MTLKKATQLVYVSLIVSLVLSILQWVIYSSNLISYGTFGRGLSTFLGLLHLVLSVPMILFFGALNAKQQGGAADRPE
jgi:uncharacterized BrkB/YihY/UPF0761 family membrane protein